MNHACRMAYSANEHGWSAGAFHAQVDTFGAAVVLGSTAGGAVFGAYNPRGWIGEFCTGHVLESCMTPSRMQSHHQESVYQGVLRS